MKLSDRITGKIKRCRCCHGRGWYKKGRWHFTCLECADWWTTRTAVRRMEFQLAKIKAVLEAK